MPVVDCQVHLHNRTFFEAHLKRAEPPWAERLNGGYVFHSPDGTANRVPASCYEVDARMEALAAEGIDTVVSSLGAFTVDHLPTGPATELAMQLNEEHAELERRYPGRYYGLATLPMQDPQAAIETLEHAVATLGLRGVCIGSNVNGDSIAAPQRDPVFRRIQDLGVPVFLHPAAGTNGRRPVRHGHERAVESLVDSTIAALDLVFAGVLDRCPRLRVVHPHLGGVLPYVAPQIDELDDHAPPGAQQKAPERPPSEYLARFFTDTASLNPRAMRLAADTYGLDRLLYGSDYPYREPATALGLVRSEFSGEDLNRVLFANAAALLGLEVARAP